MSDVRRIGCHDTTERVRICSHSGTILERSLPLFNYIITRKAWRRKLFGNKTCISFFSIAFVGTILRSNK
jgi:hypothetical protein